MIKEWINESEIVYTEGPISLNWTQILSQIRSDIEGFIEQGGWSFLQTEAPNSDSESINSDSNFDEDEQAGSDDESDFSGSEEDGSASDEDAKSSDVKTGSEDTEGMDWDEMER